MSDCPGRVGSVNAVRDADGGFRETAASPVSPSSRIDCIDVLRGLALFGVLAINVVFEFRVSIFEQFLPPPSGESAIDHALKRVLAAAIEMKAFALFSFLFGVGLAIQFDRLAANARRLVLLTRRLIVLLAIGVAHLVLIWNGDILVEYAVAGLVALPLLYASSRLMCLAGAATLLLFLAMPLLPPVVPFASVAWTRNHIVEAALAYGAGGFPDALAFRIREIPAILPLHILVFPRTVALVVFGVLAWRAGIFRRSSRHGRLLRGLAIAGLLLGGGLAFAAQELAIPAWLSPAGAGETAQRLGDVVLSMGYAATVVGFASGPAGQRMFAWAAPVGRMAFTNYVAQSIVFGWIFYGYGLGLFGRLNVATALTIGVVVYLAQVTFSHWWLGRYRFGPVEWLWRSLMYGSRQKMV